MSGPFEFVVFDQSCSVQVFELCARIASELGPTLLHTGTDFSGESKPGLTVIRGPAYDNRSYSSRLRTWSAYVRHALNVGLRLRGRPVVMVSSNPPFGPFVGYTLRKLKGFRYLVRILDVYPDAIVKAGLATGIWRLLPATWERANRIALESAEHVVTLGECMRDRVQRFVTAPVRIIPSWLDVHEIAPRPKAENWFAQQHDQLGKLTVIYSGNLGITHDFSGVFEAARRLRERSDIQFVFIGGGGRKDEISAATRGLPNCRVLPNQPKENLPYSMTCGDVAIVALGESGQGISMPSKTYHMMSAGAAILGISFGDNDLKRTIEHHQCGINVDPRDAQAVVAAVERFRADPEFLSRCRINARMAAEREFSAQVCIPQYLELLDDMRHK
ncbi:MAG TPA: glycosyltransferase family 4 protein [Polyangiaceae bacterium]|nr:glycosyltransferase family 4 protein [Polyangiaceae bacterium]